MTRNRQTFRLLPLLCAALALGACTSTQVKDGSAWAAGQIITNVLDIALDNDRDSYSEHEPGPGLRAACDFACEIEREARVKNRIEEHERRMRRAESRAFQVEFDEFMNRLEAAERTSGDPPLRIVVAQ